MTAYGNYHNGSEPTAYEEAIPRQVEEKKQKRAKQLAAVRARRRIIYARYYQGKYRLQPTDDLL